MKLKDLLEQYGEYEIYTDSPKHIEEAFKNLDSKDDGVLCLFAKKPKPKTVWELNNKDEHYSVTECGFIKHFDASDFIGYKRDIGNVFTTEKEAEKECERRKVETLLLKHGGRRWFEKDGNNYHIWLMPDGCIRMSLIYAAPAQGLIYFDSKDEAGKAIEEIGEERIKKALFEVK